MKYSEKLKHPKWQRRRLTMLNLANWKCEICGETEKPLHVHHIAYRGYINPWAYLNHELLVCCDFCHGISHRLMKAEDYIECCHWYMDMSRKNLTYPLREIR